MPNLSNIIGDHGESIFNTRVSKGDMFKVYFLGEKAPIVDFLLEILDPATPYYFMVQVKSTTLGYDATTGNLKAPVPVGKLQKLIARKIPTYVAGVDVNDEKVYICPAFDPAITYSSIPIAHELSLQNPILTQQTLDLLKQDVIRFWSDPAIQNYKPNYVSML